MMLNLCIERNTPGQESMLRKLGVEGLRNSCSKECREKTTYADTIK